LIDRERSGLALLIDGRQRVGLSVRECWFAYEQNSHDSENQAQHVVLPAGFDSQ
jgi:hypothetical protein